MSDLIDRMDVIDLLKLTRDSEYKKSMTAERKHKSVIRSKHDEHVAFCDYLIEYVKQMPTHQTPSNTLGALDCVDRQMAIDALKDEWVGVPVYYLRGEDIFEYSKFRIESLPSVQPRKGKWIYGEHDVAMCDGYRCDKCGIFVPWDYQHKSIDFIKDYNYCPSCGADMRGDSDENSIQI